MATLSANEWSISLFDTCPYNTYFDLFDKDGNLNNGEKQGVMPQNKMPQIDMPTTIIEITCKTLTGAKIVIHIDETKNVLNLKQYIYKKTDIMLDDQRLVYNGKILDDVMPINSYNIKNGESINLVCRLRGGMFHSTSSRADFVSLNFTNKFQRGSKMIHGLRQYGICLDTLAELQHRLQSCQTDVEIDKIYMLIENVYIN